MRDWALPTLWALQPVLAGPTFADALDERSSSFRTATSIGLWIAWAVILVALLIPRTSTLTLIRITIPASVIAATWAAISPPEANWWAGLAVAGTIGATVLSLLPSTGQRFVNGSAYGAERRLPLRAPGPLVLGLVQVVWAVVVAAAVTGPLLLAAEQWAAGAIATVLGWPLALAGTRSLHRLAQRWLVFVPAGLALVDPLLLTDSMSMSRGSITSMALAPADTVAHDLTAGALGLAVELTFARPQELVPLPRRRGERPETITVRQVLVTPTRPGVALREARDRGLPVG
jgi:hypothetical protein